MKKQYFCLLLLFTSIISYCDAFGEQIWRRIDAHQFCDEIPSEAHLMLKLPCNFECSPNLAELTKQGELSFLWGPKETLEKSILNLQNCGSC